ncbi:hypothetical protein G6F24_016116 [Rhizopus arrhizus]|nr:hypothetical protein G6F24_016116 [Rhizopus arrhizus]
MVTLIALFAQERVLFLLSSAIWLGLCPAGAVGAGIDPGHVGNEPDSNNIVGNLRMRDARAQQRGSARASERGAGQHAWH